MSFSFRAETRELNDQTRRELDGSFIGLPDGITHYELSDSSSFPAKRRALPAVAAERDVVLVHGFSASYFIYDPMFALLKQSGFRVLRYDLFGRGYSDRPDTNYNIDLYLGQLTDLLDALRLTRPVSLIGLSMGGPITATFTARHPERVDKLVLIDPAGVQAMFLSRLAKIAAAPLVGEALLSSVGNGGLLGRLLSGSLERQLGKDFLTKYLAQTQYKGFRNALLSTVRNNMLVACIDVYRRVGALNKPVLLLWGEEDRTVPLKHNRTLRRAIPKLEFHAIANTGHIPHYERPEVVNPILLNFLRK